MLYIILYWIYLFFISSIFGNAFLQVIRIKETHITIVPIIGTFVVTVIAGYTALFSGLSLVFEIVLLITACLIFIFTRDSYLKYLSQIKSIFKDFNKYYQIFIILIFFLSALKSAMVPFIIDNETYYIPTIKWLDTYGLVPGLANLHLFLGQLSGWHISNSALNLDFLFSSFNDLNGFFLVLANLYAIEKLNLYFRVRKLYLLIPGLFPIFYVLLFQFLSSPSPDLPIYVLTLFIIGEFLEFIEYKHDSTLFSMFLLVFFAFFIKVTATFLILFPIYVMVKNRSISRKDFLLIIFMAFLTLTLFFLKNFIVSGYPLYPLNFLVLHNISWILPIEMLDYIVQTTNMYGFLLSVDEYGLYNQFELFSIWINLHGLHGYFNKFMILLLFLFPIIVYFQKKQEGLVVIYSVAVIQFVLLFYTSPQYRFFLGFMMVLTMIILASIFKKKDSLIHISLGFSVVSIIVPLFFGLSLNNLTDNKSHGKMDKFESSYLIVPHPKSRYMDAIFETIDLDGSEFFTPNNIDFFWSVGDCPLPCIQLEQYNYFKYYFHVIPSMRTKNLKDGFYAKRIRDDSFELKP